VARSGGISGLAVAAVAAGGLLIISGIRDAPILDALRDIMAGRTPQGREPKVTTIGKLAAREDVVKHGARLPARPVDGSITSGFGMRSGKMHKGVDIPMPSGTPVHAADAGTVTNTGYEPGGAGNFVQVQHAGGLLTKYFHLSKIIAFKGAKLGVGEVLGLVGTTGNSSGPHLHFEVWQDGVVQDPAGYL